MEIRMAYEWLLPRRHASRVLECSTTFDLTEVDRILAATVGMQKLAVDVRGEGGRQGGFSKLPLSYE